MTEQIHVTQHALNRFSERFGGVDSTKSIQRRTNTMRRVVAFGARIKPKDSMSVYLLNGCKDVEYYLYRNIVVVIEDMRVVTAYRYDWNKWEALKKCPA